MKNQISGEFYELIKKGATVLNYKVGADGAINYLLDIRKLNYEPQFSTDGRVVSFLRIENNEVVSEYSCGLVDARKLFQETVVEERVAFNFKIR